MMHACEYRSDCAVWDEPPYEYYLFKTGISHPGADVAFSYSENQNSASEWWQAIIVIGLKMDLAYQVSKIHGILDILTGMFSRTYSTLATKYREI